MDAGLRLTLRQLYYQLVSKNVVPNTEKSYKALGNLVSDGRLAGLIDWDAIEDRNREPVIWAEYENVQELVEETQYRYRLPRWEGQDNYVELWVEKAALAGVLRPLASKYHVTLMVNRGYSSASRPCTRAPSASRSTGTGTPSSSTWGTTTQAERTWCATSTTGSSCSAVHGIDVRKLALTMEQVREYDPPPNPAKMTDSRAAKYVEEHGADSWEVDALNPTILAEIIETAFQSVTDMDMMNEVIRKEKKERKHLVAALPRLVKDIEAAVESDDGED
jgi:hypothetical protein